MTLKGQNKDTAAAALQNKEQASRTSQSIIPDVFASITPYAKSSQRHKEITDAITQCLSRDMMPLYTVSKVGFQKLIHTLDKRYQLPSRNYFSQTAIPELYSKCCDAVQQEMAGVKVFSTTTDLWSSRTTEPYISLTVHFVNEEFQLKSRCLQTSYFPDDHTGENIALGLKEALAAWNLCEDHQVAITTDNGTNIVKAVELNQWTRFQCFGHRLHLAIGNAMKNRAHAQCISRALGICRKLVGHFSHSWKKRVALREAQRELDLPEHAMVTDCSTRWGSTQKMIARVIEQQNALSKILSTDRKVRHLLPSWQDLEVLESVNKALSPLQDFTDALSGESYVSISCVKPALNLLNTSVLAEEDTDLTKSLKSRILQYLNEKYEVTQDLLNMASFMDPRFRTQYLSADETQSIKDRVIAELQELQQHQPEPQSTAAMEGDSHVGNPPAAKTKKKSLASFFKESTRAAAPLPSGNTAFDPIEQFREAVAAELNIYIYMPLIDHGEDPLKWWKFHKNNFPRLCKLAQKYLCI
ncbi:E3 SUMO-protein ligase ZBED1-like [Bufo bufo]|uniref:E3 SUMO-protein ligase ZBED1-like n=1 Tax=Bufo bufo TaxID=8384 RepID=UPI001ABEA973|nr:E3 SUMO-protein ligase ZBED1-like [Bufo bufo]